MTDDVLTEMAAEMGRRVAEHGDDVIRTAILGTDWRETAVLRVFITHPPQSTTVDPDVSFKVRGPDYEVERYADQAPPVGESAAPGTEVVTVTWPLLERLAEDHKQVANVVEAAIDPDASD